MWVAMGTAPPENKQGASLAADWRSAPPAPAGRSYLADGFLAFVMRGEEKGLDRGRAEDNRVLSSEAKTPLIT